MKILGMFGKKLANSYYNSEDFYKRRPDLAPRNVYLREGRVITKKQVDEYFAKHTSKTFSQRAEEFLRKIINKFQSLINN